MSRHILTRRAWPLLAVILLLGAIPIPQAQQITRVDEGLSPAVGFAVELREQTLTVQIAVDREPAQRVSVALGVAAGSKVTRLDGADAKTKDDDTSSTYMFAVPGVQVGADLRFAFAVAWRDRDGTLIRSERHRHVDARAPHAPLAPDPRDWAPFDLAAHARNAADQANAVRLRIPQPLAGKLTVVVEDEQGNRVRNLVSGKPAGQGDVEVVWDCLDEDGNLAAPGAYRWRSVSHPGITPEYRMAFANGREPSLRPFCPNHNIFEDAASNGALTFLAAPNTEGGQSLIAVGADGLTVQTYAKVHGTGMGGVAVAADEEWLYVAHDGPGWGQRIDRHAPDWRATIHITLTRYRVDDGKSVDFPNRQRFAKPASYEWSAAAPSLSLRGMALIGKTLYISAQHADALIGVDAETGVECSRIALPSPGPVTACAGELYAISGRALLRIDATTGARETAIAECATAPGGLAVGADCSGAPTPKSTACSASTPRPGSRWQAMEPAPPGLLSTSSIAPPPSRPAANAASSSTPAISAWSNSTPGRAGSAFGGMSMSFY